MKPLPFKMRQETAMEKYRAETWDTKEPETIAWIDSFDPHDVFFDVGANVGVYSLYAASRHPAMEIVAFEPMISSWEAMLSNVRANGFASRIWPENSAVGGIQQYKRFVSGNAEAGTSGGQIGDDGETVYVYTVDGWPFKKPHHVKIDIDGQELEVLKGMQQTMPHIKSILIEVSSNTRQAALDLILPHGFTTDNRFNTMTPHSRERRAVEGIDAENIIFTR